MEETHFAFWLLNILGLSSAVSKKLLTYTGSFQGIYGLSDSEIHNPHFNIPPEKQEIFKRTQNEEEILSNYSKMLQKGISFYHYMSPNYPQKLASIPDPPMGIYCIGQLPNQNLLSIAIVGARTCSEYGRYVARKISTTLADSGIQIISGLAKGIDGIASKGALDVGGYSCVVLGSGVDICYPHSNMDIYRMLSQTGGIISEYPPGTSPQAYHFPRRNRIISALSDVVVVIEAREHSGSLITADFALEQGREVYALPGRVTDSLSHGCNRLIRQGAGIILSPEELLKDLSVNYSLHPENCYSSSPYQLSISDVLPLTEIERKVYNYIDFDPISINKIADQTNIPFTELLNILLELSNKKLIEQIGSSYIKSNNI